MSAERIEINGSEVSEMKFSCWRKEMYDSENNDFRILAEVLEIWNPSRFQILAIVNWKNFRCSSLTKYSSTMEISTRAARCCLPIYSSGRVDRSWLIAFHFSSQREPRNISSSIEFLAVKIKIAGFRGATLEKREKEREGNSSSLFLNWELIKKTVRAGQTTQVVGENKKKKNTTQYTCVSRVCYTEWTSLRRISSTSCA